MAHVEHTDMDSLNREFFYNVTMAVGPSGTAANRRDDVMLVQYLLKGIAASAGDVVFAVGWKPPKTDTPFQVDGQMGPDTAAWIKSYQELIARTSGFIFVDGRIDPAHRQVSTVSHTMYTTLYLNIDFAFSHSSIFKTLEDDIAAPPDLRAIIHASRAHMHP